METQAVKDKPAEGAAPSSKMSSTKGNYAFSIIQQAPEKIYKICIPISIFFIHSNILTLKKKKTSPSP